MSQIDDVYVDMLKQLLKQEPELDYRSTWADGSQPTTRRILGYFQEVDLAKGFPILNLRKINWRAAIDEMDWIYLKQTNDVSQLNSKIWNQWKSDRGLIEKAYGYQIAKPTMGHSSQFHYVLHELKNNPSSRRIMMNMFDSKDQYIKAHESLIECAYATHFSVKDNKLDMTLIQRSGDAMVAALIGSWNMVQYSFLQHLIAKEVGLEVGVFRHFIQDLHLYNHHEEEAKRLIQLYEENKDTLNQQNPTIQINTENIWDFKIEDVQVHNYNPLTQSSLPVAK